MADISLDAELRAMQDIATILNRLDLPARARVLHRIAARFQADAAAAANGEQAANGAALSADSDDSLSVAMLGDLFESDCSNNAPPSSQTGAQQVRGVPAGDLADFLDRADMDSAAKSRPAVKPDTGSAWPLLPKPILT